MNTLENELEIYQKKLENAIKLWKNSYASESPSPATVELNYQQNIKPLTHKIKILHKKLNELEMKVLNKLNESVEIELGFAKDCNDIMLAQQKNCVFPKFPENWTSYLGGFF